MWGVVSGFASRNFFIFVIIPSVFQFIPLWSESGAGNSRGVAFRAFVSPQYWLSLLLTTVVLIVPIMTGRSISLDTKPTEAQSLRVQQLRSHRSIKPEEKWKDLIVKRQLTRLHPAVKKKSLAPGYAFSHQHGWGQLITEGKMWHSLDALDLEIRPISSQKLHPDTHLGLHEKTPPKELAAYHKFSLPSQLEALSVSAVAALTEFSKAAGTASDSIELEERDSHH